MYVLVLLRSVDINEKKRRQPECHLCVKELITSNGGNFRFISCLVCLSLSLTKENRRERERKKENDDDDDDVTNLLNSREKYFIYIGETKGKL